MSAKIGVLGGIGPEATGEFYNKLILGFQERGFIKSNTDFPQIIINSIPAPELIYETISDGELEPYISGLKELDGFEPDFVVMVCNTLHLYYERFQREIEAPILDLRRELEKFLNKKGIESAFLIGTPNSVKQGLYQFKDIEILKPNEREIKILSDAIFDYNRGKEKRKQINKVRKMCEKYLKNGAETIILGCTEFAVMLDGDGMPKINTIDVLVEAVIEKFTGLQQCAD